MTLSPSQRLEAYRWAYDEMEIGQAAYGFICGNLKNWCVEFENIDMGDFYDIKVLELFPELEMFKPDHNQFPYAFPCNAWFQYNDHGQCERLTVLAFCIAMIQTDLDSDDYETAFINSLKD